MVTIMMMSAKTATLGLFKIKVFRNKGYEVIISLHGVTNKILSRDSSYIVDMVMWPNFGNSSISMREVLIISVLWGFDLKNHFFEGWFWFKFNNLELALVMPLKFYTSAVKGLTLTAKRFWGLIPTFAEVTRKKLVGKTFCTPSFIE